MTRHKLLTVAVVAGVLSFSGMASAGLVTFDLATGSNGNSDFRTYTVGGKTLTVTAFNPDGTAGQVHKNSNGLGVRNDPNGNRVGFDDSAQQGEWLVFTLDTGGFQILSIQFPTAGGNRLNGADEAMVSFMGAPEATISPGDLTAGLWTNPAPSGFQNMMAIEASDGGNGFRISQITINAPEPASMALLATGLLGLAVRRRRQA